VSLKTADIDAAREQGLRSGRCATQFCVGDAGELGALPLRNSRIVDLVGC
jgi:predicted AAA+ superfamily ATPase